MRSIEACPRCTGQSAFKRMRMAIAAAGSDPPRVADLDAGDSAPSCRVLVLNPGKIHRLGADVREEPTGRAEKDQEATDPHETSEQPAARRIGDCFGRLHVRSPNRRRLRQARGYEGGADASAFRPACRAPCAPHGQYGNGIRAGRGSRLEPPPAATSAAASSQRFLGVSLEE